ncbi:hypothetical protein BCR35DRAFT_311144 [Leucosporidium creatinivorum]|uniref:Uncharacterized protein n=1 Tax=Leucosporidium creatinivorum TaxID=106004 RepID=A0A1Y2CCK2_9BASI|nr:hypothetical protein BCR35DRAFT_311144 [Leucosporidium creatinivorum]
MEHAIGDALSTASAAALSALEGAQMNQDASALTSSLPYDLLLHLFKAVAALHDDSLEGKTATWSITSTATDLLSCSLVCRDWTLPAQQVLFHGVKLTSLQGISGFVETSIIKPDLAQKTLTLSIDPDSFEMWNLCGALSPRIVEAVAACPNIRTLKVTSIAPSYAPALMQVIHSLRLLQNLLSSDDHRDPLAHELAHSTCWFIDLLKNVSTLRRLESAFLSTINTRRRRFRPPTSPPSPSKVLITAPSSISSNLWAPSSYSSPTNKTTRTTMVLFQTRQLSSLGRVFSTRYSSFGST